MGLSLKESNRQRELINYEYCYLYNIAKYGANYLLPPLQKQLKDVQAGVAEYGVQVRTDDGKHRIWKFSSFERCVQEAPLINGTVLRLGRNTTTSFDSLPGVAAFAGDDYAEPNVTIDESGAVEFTAITAPAREPRLYETISNELEALGYPRAIQYKSTRPPAGVLLELHQRHPDVSLRDFAGAVLKHCESPQTAKSTRVDPISSYKSEAEKNEWYSTPAGQEWLKGNAIPPIMTHTKRELFEWKNREHGKS